MVSLDMKEPNPAMFWGLFANEMDELFELVVARHTNDAYLRIGELLSMAGYSHVYEITSDDDYAMLIFTPESDIEVAKIVDRFADAAPSLPRWKIFKRRQRKEVKDAFAMLQNVYDVDATDATFSFSRAEDGRFDIMMYSSAAEILGDPEKEGFVTFFLEHALGEDSAMKMIRNRSISVTVDAQNVMSAQAFVTAIANIG